MKFVSIAAAPMPIWVLKTYRKLEQNCRLLGLYYQVQYWKVEITGYFNTTYQLEIRDAVGTTVGKSFAGSVVSIWALMRSPDERIRPCACIDRAPAVDWVGGLGEEVGLRC